MGRISWWNNKMLETQIHFHYLLWSNISVILSSVLRSLPWPHHISMFFMPLTYWSILNAWWRMKGPLHLLFLIWSPLFWPCWPWHWQQNCHYIVRLTLTGSQSCYSLWYNHHHGRIMSAVGIRRKCHEMPEWVVTS